MAIKKRDLIIAGGLALATVALLPAIPLAAVPFAEAFLFLSFAATVVMTLTYAAQNMRSHREIHVRPHHEPTLLWNPLSWFRRPLIATRPHHAVRTTRVQAHGTPVHTRVQPHHQSVTHAYHARANRVQFASPVHNSIRYNAGIPANTSRPVRTVFRRGA